MKLNIDWMGTMRRLGDGTLRHSYQGTPTWWIEGGTGVHPKIALALINRGLIELYDRTGGDHASAIKQYKLSDLGRSELSKAR